MNLFVSKKQANNTIVEHSSESFTIKGGYQPDKTILLISSFGISQKRLPHIVTFLEENLPSIFTSECINENNFSFKDEVVNTEFGHLFEHILLEYLCIEADKNGISSSYTAYTEWDFEKDEVGTFTVVITSPIETFEMFSNAFSSACTFMELLVSDLYKTNKQFPACL